MDPMTFVVAAIALSIAQAPSEFAIIPEPASIKVEKAGRLEIPANASILAPRKWQAIRDRIAAEFGANGNGPRPTFHLLERETLKPEEYRLSINATGVEIEAKSETGAYYALQTLLQLGSDARSLPYLEVKDAPRFAWRGLMVDVARHFWSVEDLKKFIDVMAAYKFNRLHLHLTDDQGWRIEHPSWPKLKEVASRREETDGDRKPHSGSYSREDLREIVRHASSRHIIVVPELDLPGHATALIAAYPELACFPKEDFKTATEPGVYKEILCPAKPKVFEIYRDLFRMVGEIFPGEAIHLGGIEVPLDRWQECPNCSELRIKEKLANPTAEKAWMQKRMSRLLPAGKKPMFWFEEEKSDYPNGASVATWQTGRTPTALDLAARGGWPAVVAPAEYVNFDYPQIKDDWPKIGWMPITLLQQTYALDPGYGLSEDRQKLILGAEGTLWGEYVKDLSRAFYMTYPRGLALAEACWSPMSVRSWDNFRRKAKLHAVVFKSKGIEIGPIP